MIAMKRVRKKAAVNCIVYIVESRWYILFSEQRKLKLKKKLNTSATDSY